MEKDKKVAVALSVYFGIISFMFWTELIFSSLAGLMGDVTGSAVRFGLEPWVMTMYLIALGALDVLGGVGTVRAIRAFFADGDEARGRGAQAVLMTTVAMGIYAVLHIVMALFFFAPDLRVTYLVTGVAYLVLGAGAWLAGGDFRQTPVVVEPIDATDDDDFESRRRRIS